MADGDDAGRSGLDEALRLLGGKRASRDGGGIEVIGAVDDQPVTYYEHLGYAVIVAALPVPVKNLLLHVWPAGEFARRQAEGGRQVDVLTGDAVFDPMFIVEGAPSAVVGELLEPPLRTWLAEHRPEHFHLREDDDGADVFVQFRALPASAVPRALETVAAFARGLADRVQRIEADLDLASPRTGAPFRGEPDAAHMAAARRAREREVEELRRLLAVDSDRGAAAMLIGGFLLLVAALMGLLII